MMTENMKKLCNRAFENARTNFLYQCAIKTSQETYEMCFECLNVFKDFFDKEIDSVDTKNGDML